MKWYYADNGEQVGPVSEEDFQRLTRENKISSKTLVWHSGMADWQEYGKVRVSDAETELKAKITGNSGESFCSECARAFPRDDMIRYGDSWVCSSCKPAFFQKLKEGMNVGNDMRYAGFWIRFGAKIIDGIILGVLNSFLSDLAQIAESPFLPIHLFLLQIIIATAYTTWLLGKFGATIGKMACKIKVVTDDGGKISYARAFGRYFAEILSSIMLLIGYIMAAFDEQKRTLHDRICNTRVIRK
ncbi:RDD family protein [Desulfonema magnum]|uniref:GYF and RDD domains-containing protein n=1 Tax=Desulfonema magnum TaxID=45655 RepID=A0A975GMI8_9BACT|nr:RDD family protein [Desulfonema magnum]QTA86847.1 GYF and RDD domains-containing protein [Desulfonema magnum]